MCKTSYLSPYHVVHPPVSAAGRDPRDPIRVTAVRISCRSFSWHAWQISLRNSDILFSSRHGIDEQAGPCEVVVAVGSMHKPAYLKQSSLRNRRDKNKRGRS